MIKTNWRDYAYYIGGKARYYTYLKKGSSLHWTCLYETGKKAQKKIEAMAQNGEIELLKDAEYPNLGKLG